MIISKVAYDAITAERDSLSLELRKKSLEIESMKIDLEHEKDLNMKNVEELDALKRREESGEAYKENQEFVEEIKNLKYELTVCKRERDDLKFASENNQDIIKLKTIILKKDNAIEMKDDEIKHLKRMLEEYRAMPDVQNLIGKVSELAVPSIDELSKYAKELNELTNDDVVKNINSRLDALKNAVDRVEESVRSAHPGRYRVY